MSGTASTPFFWNDYQGDPALRVCSLAAQGLWMRMLCLAAEAKKHGFVMVADRHASPEDLAVIAGRPVEEVTSCIADLERNAVFSRDRHGNIFCRRMVRAAKKRAAGRKGGKIGGRISADNKTGIHSTPATTPKVTTIGTPAPKARASSFSSSFSKEEATTATAQASKEKRPIDRVCEALGAALTEDPGRLNWPAQLTAMLEAGLELETDVLPACAEARARAIRNLQWVRKRAEAEKAKRLIATPTVRIEPADENDWRKRLEIFAELNSWRPQWGPPRGQPGHLCPEEFWTKHHRANVEAA